MRSVGRVVWCDITIPKNTEPVAGAAAAKRVCQYLLDNVLHRRSPWLGLIFDVRGGPSVIGPITLEVSSKLFISAEQARKPLAVLTVASRPIHAQHCELAAVHSRRYALVTDQIDRAMDWMTASR